MLQFALQFQWIVCSVPLETTTMQYDGKVFATWNHQFQNKVNDPFVDHLLVI